MKTCNRCGAEKTSAKGSLCQRCNAELSTKNNLKVRSLGLAMAKRNRSGADLADEAERRFAQNRRQPSLPRVRWLEREMPQ